MMALLSDCDGCCACAQLLAFPLFDGSSRSVRILNAICF
jgi:hypothetical protein